VRESRLAVLRQTVTTCEGVWTAGRVHELYRRLGIAPGRRTARLDLDRLHREGVLGRHDEPTCRYYTCTTTTTKGGTR
jgi:hypothetical protein